MSELLEQFRANHLNMTADILGAFKTAGSARLQDIIGEIKTMELPMLIHDANEMVRAGLLERNQDDQFSLTQTGQEIYEELTV